MLIEKKHLCPQPLRADSSRAKECSYSVATPAGTPRGTGGTMQAVEPERVQFLPLEKVIPMSLLVRSLSIFRFSTCG